MKLKLCVVKVINKLKRKCYNEYLAITFEAPSKKSGGGIGVIQSIESLLECGDVDYIGPKFDDDILFKLHDVKNLYYSSGLKSRFNSAIHGVTNGYYESWLRIKT
mgnify:CR=1 FL=1